MEFHPILGFIWIETFVSLEACLRRNSHPGLLSSRNIMTGFESYAICNSISCALIDIISKVKPASRAGFENWSSSQYNFRTNVVSIQSGWRTQLSDGAIGEIKFILPLLSYWVTFELFTWYNNNGWTALFVDVNAAKNSLPFKTELFNFVHGSWFLSELIG